jgi:predicted nucleic acid-binding protein
MSGTNIVIDTNIALYLLSGNETVAEILEGSQVHISFITQLELLGFKGITSQEKRSIEKFISQCHITDINDAIKRHVTILRQNYAMKLPDCIIAATALHLDLPLLTADKGFKKITELQLALFEE